MYVLYRNIGPDQWEPIGFYNSFPEAVCALEEERKKEDTFAMKIESEKEK